MKVQYGQKGGETIVNGSALQFSLRETRKVFTSPRTLGVLTVVTLVLGISGPFQTYSLFPLGPRLAYWALVAVLTFAVGSFFGTWANQALEKLSWSVPARLVVVGFAAGVPVALMVTLINVATFGSDIVDFPFILILGAYSVVIAMAISTMFFIFTHRSLDKEQQAPAPILQRLPTPLRGKLVSLSVQDHYVEVTTNKGRHLLLIRLSDAISETQGVPGLQIHRSHWVAIEGMEKAERRRGKVIVQTTAGAELPVSRSFLPKVKEAGLLG